MTGLQADTVKIFIEYAHASQHSLILYVHSPQCNAHLIHFYLHTCCRGKIETHDLASFGEMHCLQSHEGLI